MCRTEVAMQQNSSYSIVGPLVGTLGEGGDPLNHKHVLVKDSPEGEMYAAKIITCGPDTPQRREAWIAADLMKRVPRVSALVDVVETETNIVLVTEYVSRGSLRREIEHRNQLLQQHIARARERRKGHANGVLKNPFFPEEDVVKLILQLAITLRQLQTKHVVHNCVTTDHVLLCSKGFDKVRLCGFGNAVSGKETGEAPTHTLHSQFRPTPFSNHPTVAAAASAAAVFGQRNNRSVRLREEKQVVWLLGAIAYEMCTLGSRPSCRSTVPHTPLPMRYSRRLNSILQSMLLRNAASRPTRAQVMEFLRRNVHPVKSCVDRNTASPLPLATPNASPKCLRRAGRHFSLCNEVSIRSARTDALDASDALCAGFQDMRMVGSPACCRSGRATPMLKLQRIPLPEYELEAISSPRTVAPLDAQRKSDAGVSRGTPSSKTFCNIPIVNTRTDAGVESHAFYIEVPHGFSRRRQGRGDSARLFTAALQIPALTTVEHAPPVLWHHLKECKYTPLVTPVPASTDCNLPIILRNKCTHTTSGKKEVTPSTGNSCN
ncbi:putative serine/threonine-protein kinase Nek3-like isoform 8 [Trypanosoma grayi]|uniref:putative serine/threonine-protein kinase Nek3-like isoform 8 n=1 Tax=Trypanosoma grayi TaxID=71804 RepID=UPI0004F4BA65|nr:putative serine/threonine-protein kinase Nek3-like isoform 8 [Trypanosoma grayi]KEG14582.1 putative serine/threonine-protein kinase Nek3-like isoform 8 [Trypanosoma grayi]